MKRVLLCAVLCACGTEIDPAGLPSIEGYQGWGRFLEIDGPIPGHPNSVRDIFVNPVGRDYLGAGRYPLGTVIVKEIWEREGPLQRGALRYTAIMRKVGDEADVPTNDGWLFTDLRGGVETQLDLCWQTCHKAGPWDGAWFDYGYNYEEGR